MNRIKELRLSTGIQQKDLAKALGIDVSMLSRYENGVCLPRYETAKALASALNVPLRLLFPEDDLSFILSETPSEDTPQVDNTMALVLSGISKDKTKPTSRATLSLYTGLSDREVRNNIEQLRAAGFMIVNAGGGYFITEDIDEIERHYKTECKRARSIFYRLYPMRRALKDAGRAT